MNNFALFNLAMTPLSLWLLLKLSAPQDSPFAIFSQGIRGLVRQKKAQLYMGLLFSVLFVDVLLTAIDPFFTNWVGHDFAKEIFQVEGQFVAKLQSQFYSSFCTAFFTYIYIIVYPLLMLVSVLIYYRKQNLAQLRHFAAAFVGNYLIALPFYFFFPVTEVGFVAGSGAKPLLDEVFPGFTHDYRAFSGIDNCFPSLHTSLAVTAAWLAWLSPYRALKWTLSIAAGLVLFSTMYLGIHWALDVLAGIALAAVCVRLGRSFRGHD